MLIGGDFNSKAKQILALMGQMSGNDPEVQVSVEDLANEIVLDRTELKNLFEYLENKALIEIASIGGPFLYGHIKITQKGIQKIATLK